MAVQPALLETWTRGWALTRGVAPPVRHGTAWRIEVGAPEQLRRFVFGAMGPEVAARAAEIDEPFVFLKVCADPETIAPGLPPRWILRPAGHLMQLRRPMTPASDRVDVVVKVTADGACLACRVQSADGALAASGRVVRVSDVLIYDQIVVEPAYRRRGLGSLVMRRLQSAGGPTLAGLLVATDEGRALYGALGWDRLSPYATFSIDP